MMHNLPDGRSPLAIAIHWASQVTTISVEMVLPILLGVWADRSWGTKALFTILGGAVGMWIGLWCLLRLVREMDDKNGNRSAKSERLNESDDDRQENRHQDADDTK